MRRKKQTPEEEILEKSITLALSGLEVREEWEKTIERQEINYNPLDIIIGKIGNSMVKIKCFMDDCIGEERSKKIHDYMSRLLLGI